MLALTALLSVAVPAANAGLLTGSVSITNIAVTSSNILLSGYGGSSNQLYSVLTSTNPAVPAAR